MKKYILALIFLVSLIPVCTFANGDKYDFSDYVQQYGDKGAYSIAHYTGDYDATSFGDEMSDLYTFGHLYTKLYNPRTTFDGYIHTIDEAKARFGTDNEKVLEAQQLESNYYALAYDNSFRHVKGVESADGVTKDVWFSTSYYRSDKRATTSGGIPFGIKEGKNITIEDKSLMFVFEYLDNGTQPIRLEYVNDKWSPGNYTVSSYTIVRQGTNKWKTAIIYVDDAKFAPESDSQKSAFCSGKEDFVLKGDDMYISGMFVMPATPSQSDISVKNEAIPCPKVTINDPKSGRTYYFMQANGENAIAPYFTSQNWNSDGTKFIFGLEGSRMYEYDTVNETMRFLDATYCTSALNAVVTPDNQIYYIFNKRLYKIDWDTYTRTLVCKLPSACTNLNVINVTNDGRYVTGYFGGENIGARVVRIDTQTGEIDKKYNRTMYASNNVEISLGHPMINPVYPNIIFFCGEGIDTNYLHERMFIVDTNTDKMQFIYEQSYVDETFTGGAAGHEAWSATGEYLYFVKYDLGRTKGMNYVGRIPFKNGVFTGEREIINGDASYWHASPSADDNWISADTNTGEVYLVGVKNHDSYLLADFDMYTGDYNHPYQPHPHISYNAKSVCWQMVTDKLNGDSLGIGWADVSDITSDTDYRKTEFDLGDFGFVTGYKTTKSEITSQQIDGKTFAKAQNGNTIYYNIDDEYLKSVHQQLKIKVTTYSQQKDVLNIGYTSAVHDKYEWYKYEDMNVALNIDAGVNTYTIDLGYVNANNICKYASDIYFAAQSGNTYIGDVEVIPYSDSVDTNTFDDVIYSFAGGKDDYERGLDVYSKTCEIIPVTDTDMLMSEFGITVEKINEIKNKGINYVTSSNDNAWCYKAATDVDGIAKNAWYSTRVYRVNTTSSYLDLPGYIYFNVTNDVIDESDNELVVTIEYLDNRTDAFGFSYNVEGGTNTYKIYPTNTGKWKKESFLITDASISATNKTLYASLKEDFRIDANKKDLYVASITIEKADKKQISDVAFDATNGKLYINAKNKTSTPSDVNLYVTNPDQNNVFETSAKTIIQNGVGEFVFDVQKGQSAKVFLFENNLKPYKSINPLNARLTVTTNGCIIEWDEFKSTREGICYNIYCNGELVGNTQNTYFECENVLPKAKWQIHAIDFYGLCLETSVVSDISVE